MCETLPHMKYLFLVLAFMALLVTGGCIVVPVGGDGGGGGDHGGDHGDHH
jgi:hypothetical protein